ncbi:MAG TPA: GNAT family N-acetyltransferase [Pyrinomonadaceae bacterium]|nr:GNAT family N-acetyltransferase [Pyrinomonadaceae bacterium]
MEQTSAQNHPAEIEVRDCTTIEEYDRCIELQREAFALPELEISPRRHLIVTRRAGGWTLGAFAGGEMVGFVHHMVAVRAPDEIIGYSHMMAVARAFQNKGVGARLKWAQRERALNEGRKFIKWTWDPMQARNAHFNLNRLGVTVSSYGVNFYGTDYSTTPGGEGGDVHLDSDRLFADWQLDSARVRSLASGREPDALPAPAATIEIPPDWAALIRQDAHAALREQLRVRAEFAEAFAAGLVCASFQRDDTHPKYLLYESDK